MLEDQLVQKIASALASGSFSAHPDLLDAGDDGALWQPKSDCKTILSCDWFLEGTHFLRDKHPPDAVGWKCLARALSDIAAMGGVPRCFLLSLALPQSHAGRWLRQFLNGLRHASRKFSCALAGGDTTQHAEILINVTVVGEVLKGRAVLRSTAKHGDLIYVSGRLGEAEAGLKDFLASKGLAIRNDPHLRKHLYPEPRLALGAWLAGERIASAMMDLSDSLSSDLQRLCRASGVGARVELTRIPAPQAPLSRFKRAFNPTQLALHGGDDYELLFTVPSKKSGRLQSSFLGLPLTCIGEITPSHRVVFADEHGREQPLRAKGWDPFR